MKYIKIVFLSVVLLLCVQKIKAQDSINSAYSTLQTNNFNFIKFSFLNIFEPEPSLQFGYSYPIKGGKFQLQHELAYCFSPNLMWLTSNTNNWNAGIDERGFKVRTQIRAYVGYNNEFSNSKNYIAFDGMFKYVIINSRDQYVPRLDGAFTQIMDIKINKMVYAFHVIFGKEVELFENEKIMLDIYGGIGYRFKNLGIEDLPTDIQQTFESPYWYDFTTRSSIPSIMLGMKIGFGW